MYDISISDLTNSSDVTGGTGVYDVLSNAVIRQIETQYNQNRLTGTDYANVFLGSLQSVLAESVKFVLTEKTSGEQAALLAEQVKSEVKQNELDGILDKQKLKIESDISLTTSQKAKVDADTTLTSTQNTEVVSDGLAKRLLLAAQTDLENEKVSSEIKSNETDGLIDKQISKLDSDINLTMSQKAKVDSDKILTDTQNTELSLDGSAKRALISAQTDLEVERTASEVKSNETGGVIDKQKLKLDADIDLSAAQILKVNADELLTTAQTSELTLDGTAKRLLTTAQTDLANEKVSSEVKHNETDGVIDQQRLKLVEDIDASQKETIRRSLLNAVEIAHREKETILVVTQEEQLVLDGAVERELNVSKKASIESESINSTAKANADISLKAKQEDKVDAEILVVTSENAEIAANAASQRSVHTASNLVSAEQVTKLQNEASLLATKDTATAAEVVRSDAESAKRVLLMDAQTVGFKTDAKQKLMKQLFEGYGINVTTEGSVSNAPNGSAGIALDMIANDILDDLNSTVNISDIYA